MARVHSPDVLIAARNDGDLAAGRYTLILGEVHAGLPTMFQSAIFSMCPDRERVRHDYQALAPAPPVLTEASQRLNLGEFFQEAAQLLLPDERVTQLPARPLADYDVIRSDADLQIIDITTQESWPLPVFFDAMLSRSTFHVDPFDSRQQPHSPRLMIGDVVVARETWRVTAETVDVSAPRRIDAEARARNFLAVRRWAADNEVPRYVFAKSPREPKPVFLDLESQKSVELLCHLLRGAGPGAAPPALSLSEMLPDPEHCWLRDQTGSRYTSEVRLLAVDPIPYPYTRGGRPHADH
jgi:hypothetical protein